MPVENVPVCGDRCIAGKLSCRCMAPRDQEAWECRSRLARTLILRRCIVSWGRRGLGAWLRVVALASNYCCPCCCVLLDPEGPSSTTLGWAS